MLRAAARSRRGARDRPAYEEFEEAPPRRRRGGGCLGRLLMLALLLFALMLLVPALLGALLSFG
jgi:ferric-dicitrate binding protein FerR (iron transport regulator)